MTGWVWRVAGPIVAVALLTGCAASREDAGSAAPSSSAATPSPSAHQLDPNGFPLPERPDCAISAGGSFERATTSEGNDTASS
jgi:hypothetical protein